MLPHPEGWIVVRLLSWHSPSIPPPPFPTLYSSISFCLSPSNGRMRARDHLNNERGGTENPSTSPIHMTDFTSALLLCHCIVDIQKQHRQCVVFRWIRERRKKKKKKNPGCNAMLPGCRYESAASVGGWRGEWEHILT